MIFEWQFDWQDVVALAIVFAAAALLVRRAWRTMSVRRPVGCTHCSACPGGGQKQLVTITSPAPSSAQAVNNYER